MTPNSIVNEYKRVMNCVDVEDAVKHQIITNCARYSTLNKIRSGKFKLVAVADPLPEKRAYFKDNYNVPEENCFGDYKELLSKPKMADIVMICTQDKMHYEPAMMAIEPRPMPRLNFGLMNH